MYETRCGDGHYDLIKAAYDQLPQQLQDDPHILFQDATCGEHSLDEIQAPIERWHKLDPDEPCPYLLLVNYYWRLYNGPPNHFQAAWPTKEPVWNSIGHQKRRKGVAAAIQKANVWFADPAMELRLAHYFGTHQPAKARPLLLPSDSTHACLAAKLSQNCSSSISANETFAWHRRRTLHRGEVAFQTNFT